MNSLPKTILVVGGAGYVGSHVNKLLHLSGYRTVVFDNLSRGNKNNVLYGKFIPGDLSDLSALEQLFQQFPFDGIMHFAAFTDVGESVRNPQIYYQNNVVNTLNLLKMAIKHQILKFVFSSSAAVFGFPMTSSIDESHPCAPINPYGQTKRMIEIILNDFDAAYHLKSCCLRYFNAAGADPEGQIRLTNRKETNLIPLLLNPSQPVTVFGTDYPTPDGTCIRDYIHVHDLATAHLLGLEQLFCTSQSSAYNLGNARGFSVREVITAARGVTGANIPITEGPRRPGDPAILIANSTKAQQELHWTPRYTDLHIMIEHAYKAIS